MFDWIVSFKNIFSQEIQIPNLPIGSRESFTWIILKTVLCLVLDFQGFDLLQKLYTLFCHLGDMNDIMTNRCPHVTDFAPENGWLEYYFPVGMA